MRKKNIFIGVAWPYVNGELHIGHLAGYLLPADIFARFQRYIGNNVLMISGSDCHGTPITLEAEKKKISPKKLVELYHPKHKNLFKLYNISFDLYTKTTTLNHKKIVKEIFLKLAKNGYIFKAKSLQYFSPEEKRFLPDRYVEGTCPYCKFPQARGDQCDHCGKIIEEGKLFQPKNKLTGKPVITKETEHYFFDLPKLENFLKKYTAKKGNFWRKWVYKETLGWLKKGLKPKCITRDINWGIKIPTGDLPKNLQIKDADQKRIYVWFEAVIGYLSSSIEWSKKTKKRWEDFWKKKSYHYYFMGKDNLVFHTLFWPAELYGAFRKIHLPDFFMINHFLNLYGRQFSKSRGVFVDAKETGERYGVDQVRFYLALVMPENSDFSFSWENFAEINNNVLVATFGNFIYRILKMASGLKNFSEKEVEKKVSDKLEKLLEEARKDISSCQFKSYAKKIIEIAEFGNKYIDKKAPWRFERNSKQFGKAITNALLIILAINLASQPLIPRTNQKLSKMINIKIETWPRKNVILYLKNFLKKIKIKSPEPIFKKISSFQIKKEIAKLNI